MPKSLASYTDVARVLDTALEHGGLRYRLKTKGAATHFRQRAYSYRRLKQNAAAEAVGDIPGATPTTPYDALKLTVEENEVVIAFHELSGELYAPDGTRVEPTGEQPPTFTASDQELIDQFKDMVDPTDEE